MTTAPTPPTAEAVAAALALIDAMKPRDGSTAAPRMTAIYAVARAAVALVESDSGWWVEVSGTGFCWCSLCQRWRKAVSSQADVVHDDDCPALAITSTVARLCALAAPAPEAAS